MEPCELTERRPFDHRHRTHVYEAGIVVHPGRSNLILFRPQLLIVAPSSAELLCKFHWGKCLYASQRAFTNSVMLREAHFNVRLLLPDAGGPLRNSSLSHPATRPVKFEIIQSDMSRPKAYLQLRRPRYPIE